MFTAHKIVRAEERARVHCRVTCEQHDEPYLLYSLEQRKLVCIKCFNDRPLEERQQRVGKCILDKRAIAVSIKNLVVIYVFYVFKNISRIVFFFSLFQLCQQILDTVLSTRDRLMSGIGAERGQSEKMCLEQIEQISAIMVILFSKHYICGPIRLCLLSAQIMRSTASKLDVLQLSGELFKRIQIGSIHFFIRFKNTSNNILYSQNNAVSTLFYHEVYIYLLTSNTKQSYPYIYIYIYIYIEFPALLQYFFHLSSKNLKISTGRETGIKTLKPGKKKKENSRILVNTNRERSPGGTDSTLLSPCLIRRLSPTKKLI
uniref:Uncharacterized protein n=1 Tax=Heterorhabditis bacteriophora TaxID=37862 RepID=A0A1I7X2B4_HETBA